ncbi:MAG: phosphoglycerate dehydrogenase [Planctomycetia bacterium]|nr:phosphoglycerate dehydrogenase [Planctomycetia bacterium]
MPRVLVTPFMLREGNWPALEILRTGGCEVVFPPAGRSSMDPDTPMELLGNVEAVLAGAEPYTRSMFAVLKLKVIARMGVGYDAVDVPAATDHRVAVTITPGTNEPSVAETAMALVLGIARGFPARDREVRSGAWKRQSLPRLAGQVLGLAGLGRIGRAIVPRAQAFGLKIIACDPFANQEFVSQHGIELVSFDELLAQADIVSLHMPCTPETVDVINARTLARMKPGAIFINTSRGGLVDEQALYDALKSGHLAGAGLDVFKIEPLPIDSPLLTLDNVLLSPHMGGLDHASQIAMSSLAAQCIVDLHQGRWPEGCVVNESIRPDWKW